MKNTKPPRPPRCLCNSVFDWVLGIVSPSRYHIAACGVFKTDREKEVAERYFTALQAYREYEWQRRVAARSVTKDEWRAHCRRHRADARRQHAELFSVDAQQMAAAMREAVTKAGLKGGD